MHAVSRARVWDLPTRSFHWLLVLSFAVAMLTSGEDRLLDVHVFAGYAVAGLLVFRLVWGLAGSRHARFRAFAYGPRTVAGYLRDLRRGKAAAYTGHNPAGGWAVFLMLFLLGTVVLSGLLVLGGEEQQGPLAGVLSIPTGAAVHELHEALAWGMVALVAIHLTGVAVESKLHRENLVRAMLDGRKRVHDGGAPVRAYALPALALVLVVSGAGAWSLHGRWTQDQAHPYLPFTGPALAQDATWQDECGACHLAFHPSLLPQRSWERMLAEQDRHFGEDLGLAPATLQRLRDYATANAADRGMTEAAWHIDRSIAPDATPLRITDTSYWKHKHAEAPPAIWHSAGVHGKADCAACHHDAQAGTFNDSAMSVPATAHQPTE